MSVDKIVAFAGIVSLIGLIIWWFFGKRNTESVAASRQADRQTIEIIVNGGYIPNVVELEKGIPADIIFVRNDTSPCFEEVVLPDFSVRTHLPVGEPFKVTISPDTAGEFSYSCGMNMFFGKVVVK